LEDWGRVKQAKKIWDGTRLLGRNDEGLGKKIMKRALTAGREKGGGLLISTFQGMKRVRSQA